MGVPSFYRWLVGKYPKTVVSVVDPGNSYKYTEPNPNEEFDNFYLDMNAIIHPCFHLDDELFPPTTVDEVFMKIFDYIDHLFRIVRPKKLLFMAIDGVAPRAKLNQQRARRYKTAKDAHIAQIEEQKLRKEFEREGKEILPMLEHTEVSDSNVITPGTVFMQKLSKAIEYYIRWRLNNHPGWKSLEVILSDANVPGEGEHKIMSFIRYRRSISCDPNTRHCIYGLDADLIMLALATKEIHFSILREDVIKHQQQECLPTFFDSMSEKEKGICSSRQWYKNAKASSNVTKEKPYQFLNIWTLREYLELDMKPQTDSHIDLERIVDDFIFICFFTGNDFLPHMPSIDIHEGGIDLLITVYKKMFMSMGQYLVDTSKIRDPNHAYLNIKGVEMFILEVGKFEDKIFEKRHALQQKKLRRLLQEMSAEVDSSHMNDLCNKFNEHCVFQKSSVCGMGASEGLSRNNRIDSGSNAAQASSLTKSDIIENTREFKQKMKQFLREKEDLYKNGLVDSDKVKLGLPGWRERYYREKFSASNSMEIGDTRRKVVEKYVEGLSWVLHYYFVGVPSWSWFYPFYYGPFASDLKNLSRAKVSFITGSPLKPFDQLMAVLPPKSAHALPDAYRRLMKEDSPIIHFYPSDFEVDHDGKRFAWQGVCKLPFIEEGLLISAIRKLCVKLKEDEIERNSVKQSKLFARSETRTADVAALERREGSQSLSTSLKPCAPSCFPSPVKGEEDISNDRSSFIEFSYQEPQVYIPRLLEGVLIPEKTITLSDIVDRGLWHESRGGFIRPQMMQPGYEIPLPSTADETWRVAGSGWAGRGRQLADDSRAFVHERRHFATSHERGLYNPGPSRAWRPRSAFTADVYPATMASPGGISRGRGSGLMPRWSSGRDDYNGRQGSDGYGRQCWKSVGGGRGKGRGDRW